MNMKTNLPSISILAGGIGPEREVSAILDIASLMLSSLTTESIWLIYESITSLVTYILRRHGYFSDTRHFW